MARATNNPASRQRRKKVLNAAKGYYQGRRKLFQNANEAVNRGRVFAFRDRKQRKRDFRALWIARINAAARNLGITYSKFMAGLKYAGIEVDRKMLSELAIADDAAFQAIVDKAREALAARAAA